MLPRWKLPDEAPELPTDTGSFDCVERFAFANRSSSLRMTEWQEADRSDEPISKTPLYTPGAPC